MFPIDNPDHPVRKLARLIREIRECRDQLEEAVDAAKDQDCFIADHAVIKGFQDYCRAPSIYPWVDPELHAQSVARLRSIHSDFDEIAQRLQSKIQSAASLARGISVYLHGSTERPEAYETAIINYLRSCWQHVADFRDQTSDDVGRWWTWWPKKDLPDPVEHLEAVPALTDPPPPDPDQNKETDWTHNALAKALERDRGTLRSRADEAGVSPRTRGQTYWTQELLELADAFARRGDRDSASKLRQIVQEIG